MHLSRSQVLGFSESQNLQKICW